MIKEVTVKRKLPANLKPKHSSLFKKSEEATFYVLPVLALKNVVILQDTVFCPKSVKFFSEYTHIESLNFLPLAKRVINCSIKKWRTIEDGIWIKDESSGNYFHWFTDCIPRIWEGLSKNSSKKVILPESIKHLNFVVQSLKILGIESIFYNSNENLIVRSLVLTARTANFPNFDENLIKISREHFRLKGKKAPFRKVYISGKFTEKRKTHNEIDVELLVKKYGFEVIYAENLTLKKQIELMAETKVLASLHGAGLTNMLFMPTNQVILELRNERHDLTNCYFNMASALDHKYYYALNKGDSENTVMTNFTIDLDALEEVLKSLV